MLKVMKNDYYLCSMLPAKKLEKNTLKSELLVNFLNT